MKLKKITYIIGLLCTFNAYATLPEDLSIKIKNKFPMATDIKELKQTNNSYSFKIGNNNVIITNNNLDYIYFDNELYIANEKGEFSPVKDIDIDNEKVELLNEKNGSDIDEGTKVEHVKEPIKYVANNNIKPKLENKDVEESLNILLQETANNPMFSYKNGDIKASSVWNDLDLSDAFKQVYGNGTNKVIVLTDPDCYYCQAFEKMLDENKASFDATIYKLPFLLNVHPNSLEKFKFIYSQPDPAKAYTDWMSFSISDDEKDDEIRWRKWKVASNRELGQIDEDKINNLIDNTKKFIKKYKFRSTPTILFGNGVISTNGLISAEEFELFLKFSQKVPNISLPDEFKN